MPVYDVHEMDTVEAQYATRRAEWMEKRQTMEAVDQHGRRWTAMYQFQNKPFPAPVSPLKAIGWQPPHPELMPPAQYLEPLRGNRIRIRYAQWRQDVREAWSERAKHGKMAAQAMFGARAGQAWAERDADVMAEIGTMPLHPTFIDAMDAGDLWALGVPKADGTPRETPEWATSYVKTLPSVLKAEAEAELSVRFVTQDVEPVTPARPFTPAAYDEELMTAAPTTPKKAGRPRKVVEPVAADDTLTED
jgi:hypothetical protein